MPAHQAPVPVGIDLGTTYSVVAKLDVNGVPVTVPNEDGDLTTPSVVLIDGDEVTVGREALKASSLEPGDVARFVKRDIGLAEFRQKVAGKQYPPQVLEALILKKLKRDAELKLGSVRDVVVTVPAYFNEPRRQATAEAAELAGLRVLDIINEPTAAAIAYGVQSGFLDKQGEAKRAEKVLVYDLGGGTFDVTLMELDGRNYNTLATDGDVYLGGCDWDLRLAEWLAEEYEKDHGVSPQEDPAAWQTLLMEAEEAKRALSQRSKVNLAVAVGGRPLKVVVHRTQFEELTADLLNRTLTTAESVLRQAKTEWKDVARVLLVGGSTRMPAVRKVLADAAGIPVERSVSTDEAVAHGAALYAGILRQRADGAEPSFRVKNVNSHNLGVLALDRELGRPRNFVLIPRNTPLPVTKNRRFQTSRDDQTEVKVRVVEGGDASGNGSSPVGLCVVSDFPKSLPKGTPVEVAFSYQSNGRLNIQACIPKVQKIANLSIERNTSLDQSGMEEWKKQIATLRLMPEE